MLRRDSVCKYRRYGGIFRTVPLGKQSTNKSREYISRSGLCKTRLTFRTYIYTVSARHTCICAFLNKYCPRKTRCKLLNKFQPVSSDLLHCISPESAHVQQRLEFLRMPRKHNARFRIFRCECIKQTAQSFIIEHIRINHETRSEERRVG